MKNLPIIIQLNKQERKILESVNFNGINSVSDYDFKTFSRLVFDHKALNNDMISDELYNSILNEMSKRNMNISNILH